MRGKRKKLPLDCSRWRAGRLPALSLVSSLILSTELGTRRAITLIDSRGRHLSGSILSSTLKSIFNYPLLPPTSCAELVESKHLQLPPRPQSDAVWLMLLPPAFKNATRVTTSEWIKMKERRMRWRLVFQLLCPGGGGGHGSLAVHQR